MVVFNPLSLYTTYLGWQQYQLFFDALWQTGLLYLGFLRIGYRFLKSVLVPAGSHFTIDHALNHFLFELAAVFFICAFFVYPCVPLEQKGLVFKPLCTFNEKVPDATVRNTGTTYDEMFADLLSDSVKIPLGFAILQNFSSSFSYGLMKASGCMDSLHAIEGDLLSTHLPSGLKKQAVQFHRQCFLEARTSYRNKMFSADDQQKIALILKHHGGEEDLNWLGSKTFKTYFYDGLMAKTPVEGFSYAQYPNPHFQKAAGEDAFVKENLPMDGYPTCNQWWLSLRQKLVEATQQSAYFDKHLGTFQVLNRVLAYKQKHQLAWNSDLTPEDYIAKVLLRDNKDIQNKSTEGLMAIDGSSHSAWLSRGIVNMGQTIKSWTSTPLKREAVMQSLPILQAFFYFFLILLTPLILALSGYSTRALGSLCALFFMANFIPCLWHYGGWLDRSIADLLGDNDVLAAIRNLSLLFYFIAPMVLLKLSVHFGGEGGAAIGSFMDGAESIANQSADAGGKQATTGVKWATTMGRLR